MIIKEYRIPLPMTVEEYRIAQLYMIQVGGAGCAPGTSSALWVTGAAPAASNAGLSPTVPSRPVSPGCPGAATTDVDLPQLRVREVPDPGADRSGGRLLTGPHIAEGTGRSGVFL